MLKENSERKILEKICCLIVILTAIITPWLLHDREITQLKTTVITIEKRMGKMEDYIYGHLMSDPKKQQADSSEQQIMNK
jgi:hypothetical protein